MDLLKKELERKRKAVELAKQSKQVVAATSSSENTKKRRTYLKAADLRRFQEKQEEEERAKEKLKKELECESSQRLKPKKRQRQEEIEGGNIGVENNNRKDDSNATKKEQPKSKTSKMEQKPDVNDSNSHGSRSLNGGVEVDGAGEVNKKVVVSMTSEQITKELRELGIPVWLFGERDDTSRMGRLNEARETRKAALAGMSEMDEFRLGSGHGIRNPFLGGKKGNNGLDDDITDGTATTTKSGIIARGTGKSLIKNRAEDDTPKEKTGINTLMDEMNHDDKEEDEDDPHKKIHRFFKSLLRQWEEDLSRRPESIKRTAVGKNETKTLKQCRDYIRPLFKLCKTRRLEDNLMNHILKIVNYCKMGEFVKAHDSYMDVAIGRAAWPIGVTMVGIHARSGRAKIESSNVAHVMNSELQRKYLTSVKRLMSYYQKKRTDVAPSKKVMNL